jgi:hypothetical protein
MFDKTMKEAYLKDVALPYSHNHHSTITEGNFRNAHIQQ